MKSHFKKKKYNKGFSLIEVIVSIGIISIGIIPILNLFNSALRNEMDNKNRLIALYLAEENIEIIRQLRDNDALEGYDWLDFCSGAETHRTLSLKCSAGVTCELLDSGWEVRNTGVGSGNFRIIYYDTEEKYYGQMDPAVAGLPLGWQKTGFKRWMKMEDKSKIEVTDDENNTMKMTVYVSYADEVLAEISTYLYNWQ